MTYGEKERRIGIEADPLNLEARVSRSMRSVIDIEQTRVRVANYRRKDQSVAAAYKACTGYARLHVRAELREGNQH